jgi:hypothetical protein
MHVAAVLHQTANGMKLSATDSTASTNYRHNKPLIKKAVHEYFKFNDTLTLMPTGVFSDVSLSPGRPNLRKAVMMVRK